MKKFHFTTLFVVFASTQAFAQQSVPNCPPPPTIDAQIPAVGDATSAAQPVLAHFLPPGTSDTEVTAIVPNFNLGGSAGYGATAVEKGDSAVLTVSGLSRAGSTKGYFAPGTLIFYSPKDKVQLGAGWNGMSGSSSPDSGSVNASGDLILNGLYTAYQTKSGKFAVAGMATANFNTGSKAFDNDLTTHTGVSPDAIVTYAPNNKNSFTVSAARVFSLGGSNPDGTPNTLTAAEWDHQFGKITSYVGTQTSSGDGTKIITPFGAVGYTHGNSQFLGNYSNDIVNSTGDRNRVISGGYMYTFTIGKKKSSSDEE